MKKSAIIIGLALAIPITIFGQTTIRVGYINSNEVLQQWAPWSEARAQVERESAQVYAQYNSYVTRIDSLQTTYDQMQVAWSAERRAQAEQEINALYQEATQFQQENLSDQGRLAQLQSQLFTPLMNRLNTAIQTVGASNSYDLIFDTAAGSLVYGLPAYDVSNLVLTELRRASSGAGSAGGN